MDSNDYMNGGGFEGPRINGLDKPTFGNNNNAGKILPLIVVLMIFAGGMFVMATHFIDKVENDIFEDVDCISDVNNIDTETVNTKDYIYVGEWGLKIKIPNELNYVGYNFWPSEDSVYEHLYINGVSGNDSKMPEFAKMSNYMGLGVVTRYLTSADQEVYPNTYLGYLVFSDDTYSYYYSGSQAYYSTDEDELILEKASRDVIETMLENPDNYSKI